MHSILYFFYLSNFFNFPRDLGAKDAAEDANKIVETRTEEVEELENKMQKEKSVRQTKEKEMTLLKLKEAEQNAEIESLKTVKAKSDEKVAIAEDKEKTADNHAHVLAEEIENIDDAPTKGNFLCCCFFRSVFLLKLTLALFFFLLFVFCTMHSTTAKMDAKLLESEIMKIKENPTVGLGPNDAPQDLHNVQNLGEKIQAETLLKEQQEKLVVVEEARKNGNATAVQLPVAGVL